ncbi:hypothetical protein M0802_004444 [Mischocyttarus mexicanus]|nr:hypothetical protein M0802_004444 [Mischocyttarus mexicanus]
MCVPYRCQTREAEFLRLRFDRSAREWKTRTKRRNFKAPATSASVRRPFQEREEWENRRMGEWENERKRKRER